MSFTSTGGSATEPTLLIGDFLPVTKLVYARPVFPLEDKILPDRKIERDDIVVFKYPNDLAKDFVKRVIALEGEKIEIKGEMGSDPKDHKIIGCQFWLLMKTSS